MKRHTILRHVLCGLVVSLLLSSLSACEEETDTPGTVDNAPDQGATDIPDDPEDDFTDRADSSDPDQPDEGNPDQPPPGTLCSEDDECGGAPCVFLDPEIDQGFCSLYCNEQSGSEQGCPDGFECLHLRVSEERIQGVCVPGDLCFDDDGDGYGVGFGCLGNDCDESDPNRNSGQSEICDGIDNNCNGAIDDGVAEVDRICDTGFPGACGTGRMRCLNGSLECQAQIFAEAEVCDGIDNDCDGIVDENESGDPISIACYSGPDETAGVGLCQQGERRCVDGALTDCLEQVLPFPEICDGLDNDCNGEIDEGGPSAGVLCDTGNLGACQRGETSCNEDGTITCEQIEEPGEEICDGIDNDCDGLIDEDEEGQPILSECYDADPNTEDVGICTGGFRACVGGEFGSCEGQVLPIEEVCDGIDNDCDGETDEGNPAGGRICSTGLLGVCAQGTTACTPEGPVCEPSAEPTEEICDGLDNDCDGLVDEDDNGENLQRTCYSGQNGTAGVGICSSGAQVCVNGSYGSCVGEVLPSVERCDGIDNNCNGTVDDGNPGSNQICSTGLQGICAAGLTTCEAGALSCVPSEEAGEEVCDGLDNDCDGEIDEDEDGDALVRSCYNANPDTAGVGLCVSGSQTCNDGAYGTCQDQVLPSAELCDGRDNDCDGEIDNGNPGGNQECSTGLQGVCAAGRTSCEEGSLSCAPSASPSAEICDGLDNDCDGLVDEDEDGEPLVRSCYGADRGTLEHGTCQEGQEVCNGGSYGVCQGQVLPSAELCDGLDNDCDGLVDDGNPGGGQVCSTGMNLGCDAGVTACQEGALVCLPAQEPSAEVCDGLDNDCDGLIDEDEEGRPLTESCYSGPENTEGEGACAAGVRTCTAGDFGACVGDVLPSEEVCDGLDNNCDGEADDGNPGGGVRCNTELQGLCAAGLTTCGEDGVVCAQQVFPTEEICDGLDNDCDGLIDEGPDEAPLRRSCFSGDDDQLIGACQAGVEVCQSGEYGVCQGQILPSPEICDGIDNNCDGTVDDENPGGGISCATGQEGICAQGTTACTGGAVACVAQNVAENEVCDGLDNDCDGVVDEGFANLGEACFAGVGPCRRAGVWGCNPNDTTAPPVCDAVPGEPNAQEVCDYNDDNCNGAIDEGFVNGDGVYNSPEHCGGCASDCNNQWPGGAESYNVAPTCEVSGQSAVCGFACLGDSIDADGIPDNGCEFEPDTGAIYVASPENGGNDADNACGTWDNPCSTLAHSLQKAQSLGRERLRVSDGLYRETLTVVEGISLLGGHSARTWQRNPDIYVSAITGNVGGNGDASATLTARDVTVSTEISGFTISAQNGEQGESSVAVLLIDSDQSLFLQNNTIYAATGGNGISGGHGNSGAGGTNAAPGNNSLQSNQCSSALNIAVSSGGQRFCPNPDGQGTTNLSGGNGSGSTCPEPGQRNGSASAGGGPAGGAPGLSGGNLRGQQPSSCTVVDIPADPEPGLDGADGNDGPGGGNQGNGAGVFDFTGLTWTGNTGENGTHGQHGSGGGGGGAGAGLDGVSSHNVVYYGATGGGGGSGGCAGSAGLGGSAAGGSFGVLVAFSGSGASNAADMPRLEDNRIARGNGGSGGDGGNGGAGGDPGLGAGGGIGVDQGPLGFCILDGSTGGRGGRGGHGGGGAGGSGGASYDIYVFGSNGNNPGYLNSNSFDLGTDVSTGGEGGRGGTSSNTGTGIGQEGPQGASGNVLFVDP